MPMAHIYMNTHITAIRGGFYLHYFPFFCAAQSVSNLNLNLNVKSHI